MHRVLDGIRQFRTLYSGALTDRHYVYECSLPCQVQGSFAIFSCR